MYTRGFSGVLSPNIDVSFELRPPTPLLEPGYYMDRLDGFVTVMQPKVNNLLFPRKLTPGGFLGC